MAYKSVLLSTLIPIRYSKTIDSLDDLDKTGFPLIMARGISVHSMLMIDPRPVAQRVFNKSQKWSFPFGQRPDYYAIMYAKNWRRLN